MKNPSETKARLIGSALDLLSTAIWLDEEGTISHDVIAMHHLLSREYREHLHLIGSAPVPSQRRAQPCAQG